MSLALALMAASTITSAYGEYGAASAIAGSEKAMAQMEYEKNKEEIKKAYGRNFSSMMEQYTEQRAGMVREVMSVSAALNSATASKSNVDNDFNSYRSDTLNKLDSDFMNNLNEITEEQIFNMRELAEGRTSADLNNNLQLNNMLGSISNKKIQSQQNSVNKAMMGAFNSASHFMDYKNEKRDKDKAKVEGAEDGVSSFGGMSSFMSTIGGFF